MSTFSDELAHSEWDTQTLMPEPWLCCKRMKYSVIVRLIRLVRFVQLCFCCRIKTGLVAFTAPLLPPTATQFSHYGLLCISLSDVTGIRTHGHYLMTHQKHEQLFSEEHKGMSSFLHGSGVNVVIIQAAFPGQQYALRCWKHILYRYFWR